MSTIDEIMRRNREARERLVKAGQQYETRHQRLAQAEAALAEQMARAEQEAEANRAAQERIEATILGRKRRLHGMPPTTNEIRRDILLLLTQHNVYWEEIVAHTRRKHLDAPRRAVYVYLRSLGWSYPAIGKFCDRDHASIMNGVQRYHEANGTTNE